MVQAGQDALRRDLASLRAILTPEQWDKLPESVRNPRARPQGDGPAGGEGRGRFRQEP
jgi:hypothetical protein